MIRHAVIFYVSIALAVWGIADVLIRGDFGSLMMLMIPIAIFGVVFLLYKFPPGSRRRKKMPKVKPSARTMAKVASSRKAQPSKKRKEYPFYVIEGQKGKEDEDIPKYH
ncbi:hypothetical protein MKX74_16390 [Paenibacillus sp. FSL K6-1230]|uniref:hypothetical protein n=1 Tax=Paenibacillus sp. FSL K6-1230 TaxID=2921603 RepID=UPI0030FA119E